MFRHIFKHCSVIVIFLISLYAVSHIDIFSGQSAGPAQVISSYITPDIPHEESILYVVSRVIDGDTIIVNINGKKEIIRLIGVDTPEILDPRKPVQCFGKEASFFLKKILEGKTVRLETDLTQSDRDTFGRLLRYVYLNTILVNEEIISSGYGFEYTYDVPYRFQKEFKSSQAYAEKGGLGLWSPTACGGKL